MLRGTRPTAALAASLVVLTGALSACGSDTPGTGLPFADRLEAVTISGDIGEATIEFKERMAADEVESETLVEGTGAALEDDDEVFVNYVIGNGYTRDAAIDSFGKDAPAVALTVGAPEVAEPQNLDQVLANVLGTYVEAGVTKGSRIVVTGDSQSVFGPIAQSKALAVEGIGNDDGLVVVMDVEDVEVLDGPEGAVGKNPGWAPELVFNGNGPTGFDFSDIPKPEAKAKQLFSLLKTGTGPKVEKGDLLVVNYLGSVFGAEEAFLETYSAEPQPIPVGSFAAPGVNEVLEGQTVGSRVVMRIPPAQGFGPNPPSETVPKNATLYFVVDILAAV